MSTRMENPSTIAIDGPAAAGKTTLALALADRLSYLYFDTGVMYRAVTLAALNQGLDLKVEADVVQLAGAIVIDVRNSGPAAQEYEVFIDDEKVTHLLRSDAVDANVSRISAYAGVRKAMVTQQRRIAERGRVVMVGRDIGTVVLPGADLKLYLEASVEIRARRRWQEIRDAGREDTYEHILAQMRMRDEIDSTREVAPLRAANDAVRLDTGTVSVQDMLEKALTYFDLDQLLAE